MHRLFGILVGVAIISAAILSLLLSIGYYLSPQSSLQISDAIVAISGGDTQARTTEAIKLYDQGWSKHIIFSGAAFDPISPSNALVMAKAAEAAGVPSSAITIESNSMDTAENAVDVGRIIKAKGYHKIILVTSPYHQRRASILFKRSVGPDVVVLNQSSIDPAWRRSDWWATSYSTDLTLSELAKTLYEIFSPQGS
jgi:uncharacterized SAM-binding protein YcdF (DUF218 family)